MTIAAAVLGWALVGVSVWTGLMHRSWPRWLRSLIYGFIDVAFFLLNLLVWHTLWAQVVFAVLGVWNFWDFWRNRPRGKGRKAAKMIGAKARAVRDALVAAMPKPSAVPLPAGAS